MKPRFASLVSFHTRHTLVAFGQFRAPRSSPTRPFSSSAFRSFPRRGWSEERIEVTPVWIFVVCVSSSCLRSSLEVDSFWEAMDKFVDPIELLRTWWTVTVRKKRCFDARWFDLTFHFSFRSSVVILEHFSAGSRRVSSPRFSTVEERRSDFIFAVVVFFSICESSNHGEGRRVYAGTDDDSRDESSFIRRHHGPISFSTTAALKSGSLPLWNSIHTEDYVQVESAMHPSHSVNLEIMRNLDRYVPCLDYSDTLLPCSSFFFFNTCATNAN